MSNEFGDIGRDDKVALYADGRFLKVHSVLRITKNFIVLDNGDKYRKKDGIKAGIDYRYRLHRWTQAWQAAYDYRAAKWELANKFNYQIAWINYPLETLEQIHKILLEANPDVA